jgi:type II secretory pathway pseudopilin PulG
MSFIRLRSRNTPQPSRRSSAPNYSITQFPNYKIRSNSRRRKSQQGYILLILLLFVALLSIGFLAAVRKVDFQVKRDREEELIHRGVQYSRAVRRYFKKFGRYPTRIEELESTNNVRFLRKRYKDPMNRDPKTGQERDFKILRLQDVQMSFNSAPTPGLVAASDLASADPAQASAEVQAGAPGALNGGTAPIGRGPSAIAGQQNPSTSDQEAQPDQAGASTGTPPPPQPLSQQLGPNGAPQVFGGGAIAGVASLNKDKTIREFNKKNHYNQWQFIYDPTTDRGGLLMTPNQPPLKGAVQPTNQQQNGQPGFAGPNPGGINPQGGINPTGTNQPNEGPIHPNMPPDQNQ